MAFGQDKKTARKRGVEASNSTSRCYDETNQQGQDAKSASLNEAFHSATMRTKPAVVKKRARNRVQIRHPVICHRCGEHSCIATSLCDHYAPSDSGPTATRCPYTTEKFYLDGFSEEVYNVCFNQEVAGIREEQAYEWARTIFYDPEREEEEGPDAQVYAYVTMRDGVAVPTYIGVTTDWNRRDEADYKKLPGEIRVVVVDNAPEWICRSIESCILYCFNINQIPPENRVLRNNNHMHAQMTIPAWLREMVTDGHATMEGVFKFLRTEAMRMLKGSLGAEATRLSKELWMTPAQVEDRNKSLSTPVRRKLSYSPEEVEQDFEAFTTRYYDRADEEGTFPEEERRPIYIRADGSAFRVENDQEQGYFEEALEKAWRSREASRTKDYSAQPLRHFDQDDDDEDEDEDDEEDDEDDEDEDEEEGDATENWPILTVCW